MTVTHPPRQRGTHQRGHQQYSGTALHSHSRLPALHCLRAVSMGCLPVASKELVHQAVYMGSAEQDSRSRDEFADLLDLLAVRTGSGRSQAMGHTLQQAAAGNCWSMDSNLLAAEDTRRRQPHGFRGPWENTVAAAVGTHLDFSRRTNQDHALPRSLCPPHQ